MSTHKQRKLFPEEDANWRASLILMNFSSPFQIRAWNNVYVCAKNTHTAFVHLEQDLLAFLLPLGTAVLGTSIWASLGAGRGITARDYHPVAGFSPFLFSAITCPHRGSWVSLAFPTEPAEESCGGQHGALAGFSVKESSHRDLAFCSASLAGKLALAQA